HPFAGGGQPRDDGVPAAAAEALAAALGSADDYAAAELAAAAAAGGNPVIPWLAAARERVAGLDRSTALHAGLTSQDVMDSALMLLAQDALEAVAARAADAVGALAALAARERGTLCLARTLTQPALPTTAGLRIAQWAAGLDAARQRIAALLPLPVQAGGAAGTQAGYGLVAQPAEALAAALAAELGLADPGAPWQTNRQPVLDLAVACAGIAAAGQRIAGDVLIGARPEVGELAESGGGESSAMPQKSNPTVSVLLHRTGIQAPGALATIASAVGASIDDRADGAWHAEWPALRALLLDALTASRLLAELAAGLRVDAARMGANLEAAGPGVVGERLVHALRGRATRAQIQAALAAPNPQSALAALAGGADLAALLDPAGYTGRAEALTDRILHTLAPS
ncbi:hypothetical protein GSY69_11960, partial [Brevibacterium sp. 5221]